jgi:hypothetical protein
MDAQVLDHKEVINEEELVTTWPHQAACIITLSLRDCLSSLSPREKTRSLQAFESHQGHGLERQVFQRYNNVKTTTQS